MMWTDQQKVVVLNGGAATISVPGVEAPCVVVRKDVFDRLQAENVDDPDADLVDAPYDVWVAELEKWLESLPPDLAVIDDSRESIYGDDRVS
jgi:hypothetical protein